MPVAHETSVVAGGNGVTSMVFPGMTTSGTNRYLQIEVHSSADAAGVVSVTGGDLTFVKVDSISNGTNNGWTEVWRSLAASTLSAVVFTVNFPTGQFPQASGVASAYSGTDITGTEGSGAVGAISKIAGSSTAPSRALTTTRANSLVTAGIGGTGSGTFTAGTGQTLNGQATATPGLFSTSTQLRRSTLTAASGTSVTMNATLSATAPWGIIAVEIREPLAAAAAAFPKAYQYNVAVNRASVY